MTYMLVPHSPTQAGEAVVWVAAIKEARPLPALSLQSNAGQHPLGAWTPLDGNGFTLDYQRVTVTNLTPGGRYEFVLTANGQTLASCRLRTLPDRLPTFGEDEFRVLLASCFCSRNDEAGSLGWTFRQLPGSERPDIKILSGDQVYLDDPATHFLWHTHTKAELLTEHFENYNRTWLQGGVAGGFRGLLQDGANYFSSDDHEFWNNAPSWASLIRDSWSAEGRANWLDVALSLYKAFQTDKSFTTFDIGSLSFFIADTRMNRSADQTSFMQPTDIEALQAWVSRLRGLGVLVIGQPVLSARAGWRGKLTDWNLADYDQYGDFIRALDRTEHSILILTGDVHYGRVARCQLRPEVELVEVISSPTALVNKLVGGKWNAAPARYPAFDVPGAFSRAVTTDLNFTLTDNHFLTLAFSAVAQRTRVLINAWPIVSEGRPVNPIFVMERTLG